MPIDYASLAKKYKESPITPISNTEAPTQEIEQPKPLPSWVGSGGSSIFGLAKELTKAVVKPVAQTAVQFPRSFAAGVTGLAGMDELSADLSKPVNVPFLGEVKGLSAVPQDVERYGTQSARETAGQALEMTASILPGGEAKGVVGAIKTGSKIGALSSAGGALKDEDAGIGEIASRTAVGTAIGGGMGGLFPVLGKTYGGVKGIIAPEAEQALTSAIKPGKNNVNFPKDLKMVMEDLAPHGDKITDLRTFDTAIKGKKMDIWESVMGKIQSEGRDPSIGLEEASYKIKQIASKPIFKLKNPEKAEQLEKLADSLREKKLNPLEAESILEDLNAQEQAYYSKNMTSRYAAEKADPELAADLAIASALRSGLDSKMEGFSDLKRLYGSYANIGKEVSGRIPVSERQNMMSLAEQISAARTAGNVGASVLTGNLGSAAGHALDFAVSRAAKTANTSDALIARAFSGLAKKQTPSLMSKATPAIQKTAQTLKPAVKVLGRGAIMKGSDPLGL